MTHTPHTQRPIVNEIHNLGAIRDKDGSLTILFRRYWQGHWCELHFASEESAQKWLVEHDVKVPIHMFMTITSGKEGRI